MFKRKSLIGRKNLTRNSKYSIGSAILDPDTGNLDEEQPYWWKHLENNTLSRLPLNSTKFSQSTDILNSDSEVDSNQAPDQWWNMLNDLDSTTSGKMQKRKKEKDITDNNVSQETTYEPVIRKAKLPLHPKKRKSRGNIFLDISSASENTVSSLPRNKTASSPAKRVDNIGRSDESSTSDIIKPRPDVSKKTAKNKSKNVSGAVLAENELGLPKRKSIILASSSELANSAATETSVSIMNEDNISAHPKAQSTVLEGSAMPEADSTKDSNNSIKEHVIRKPKSALLIRHFRNNRRNLFNDVIDDEETTMEIEENKLVDKSNTGIEEDVEHSSKQSKSTLRISPEIVKEMSKKNVVTEASSLPVETSENEDLFSVPELTPTSRTSQAFDSTRTRKSRYSRNLRKRSASIDVEKGPEVASSETPTKRQTRSSSRRVPKPIVEEIELTDEPVQHDRSKKKNTRRRLISESVAEDNVQVLKTRNTSNEQKNMVSPVAEEAKQIKVQDSSKSPSRLRGRSPMVTSNIETEKDILQKRNTRSTSRVRNQLLSPVTETTDQNIKTEATKRRSKRLTKSQEHSVKPVTSESESDEDIFICKQNNKNTSNVQKESSPSKEKTEDNRGGSFLATSEGKLEDTSALKRHIKSKQPVSPEKQHAAGNVEQIGGIDASRRKTPSTRLNERSGHLSKSQRDGKVPVTGVSKSDLGENVVNEERSESSTVRDVSSNKSTSSSRNYTLRLVSSDSESENKSFTSKRSGKRRSKKNAPVASVVNEMKSISIEKTPKRASDNFPSKPHASFIQMLNKPELEKVEDIPERNRKTINEIEEELDLSRTLISQSIGATNISKKLNVRLNWSTKLFESSSDEDSEEEFSKQNRNNLIEVRERTSSTPQKDIRSSAKSKNKRSELLDISVSQSLKFERSISKREGSPKQTDLAISPNSPEIQTGRPPTKEESISSTINKSIGKVETTENVRGKSLNTLIKDAKQNRLVVVLEKLKEKDAFNPDAPTSAKRDNKKNISRRKKSVPNVSSKPEIKNKAQSIEKVEIIENVRGKSLNTSIKDAKQDRSLGVLEKTKDTFNPDPPPSVKRDNKENASRGKESVPNVSSKLEIKNKPLISKDVSAIQSPSGVNATPLSTNKKQIISNTSKKTPRKPLVATSRDNKHVSKGQKSITNFLKVENGMPASVFFSNKSQVEELKKKLDRVKEQAMADTQGKKTEKVTSPIKKGITSKSKKQGPTKPIHKAYLVNGQPYKPPKLVRPKMWVTDRFYKHLWKHLEPKYKLETRVVSENFVQQLANVTSRIMRVKSFAKYKTDMYCLMKEMARLGIIRNRWDFYNFCHDFFPYELRLKLVPMMLPGNIKNIPYSPEKLYEPI